MKGCSGYLNISFRCGKLAVRSGKMKDIMMTVMRSQNNQELADALQKLTQAIELLT